MDSDYSRESQKGQKSRIECQALCLIQNLSEPDCGYEEQITNTDESARLIPSLNAGWSDLYCLLLLHCPLC